MNPRHLELVAALKLASQAALAADPGEGLENDGGTCNLDSPVLTMKGLRKETAKQIGEAAGVELDDIQWLGKRRFFVRTPTRGQANRRSRMVEAARTSLCESGFDCCVFYHMD